MEKLSIAQLDGVVLLGQAVELRKRASMVKANDLILDKTFMACTEPQTRSDIIARLWVDVRVKECIGMWMSASLALQYASPLLIPQLIHRSQAAWFHTVLRQPDVIEFVTRQCWDVVAFRSYIHDYLGEHLSVDDAADLAFIKSSFFCLGKDQEHHRACWNEAQTFLTAPQDR